MKKTFLTLAAAAFITSLNPIVVSAQNSAVTNAILNQRSGLLDKARVDIDKAILNEKTSGKAKTWYTRGEIYQGMLESPIYGKQLQSGEGVNKAYESYSKVIELDTKDGEFGKQAVAKMENLYGQAFNDAVNSYNAKDYDKAIASYKLASQIKPQDTTVVLYSAYASDGKAASFQQKAAKYSERDKSGKGDSVKIYSDLIAKSYGDAKANYNRLLGMNYKSVTLYSRLLQIAKQEKNQVETAKSLQQALAAYPMNKAFMLEDLNMSLASGKGPDAIDKINKSIVADPANSNLYAVRGSLYDLQKKTDLAQADYKKAVELDPNNFDALFNLGVYNFNKGIDMVNRARKMDLKMYQASGKKLEIDGKKIVELSIPYFEKASQLQPNEKVVLVSLQKAYANTGRMVEAQKLSAKLEAMNK